MEYDIFVSYSRKDSEIVQSVVDRLKGEGYRCWMDVTGIESSDEFKRVLVKAIRQSKVILFFSSANSNSTEWTVKEINIAVQMKKPIIPVRLDDAPYDDSILFDLSGLDYISCPKDSKQMFVNEKLMRGVVKHCGIAAQGVDVYSKGMPESNPRRDGDCAVVKRTNGKWLRTAILMVASVIGISFFLATRFYSAQSDSAQSDVLLTDTLLHDEFKLRDEILGWPINLGDEEGINSLISELLDLRDLIQDWKWLNNLSDPKTIATLRQSVTSMNQKVASKEEFEVATDIQIKMLEAELQSVESLIGNEIKSVAPVFKLSK